MKAYTKDVIKTIQKGKKRFFAIMLIAALGVCMLAGLKAACDDLRYSADKFFDEQNLMDVMIVSTMGLTEEDVTILSRIDGVEAVEGAYSETVLTEFEGQTKQVTANVLSQKDINMPYLLDGRMPTKASEILVTQNYISETEKAIGDTVVIEEKMENSAEDDDTDDDTDDENADDENADDDNEDLEIEEKAEEPNFLITEYTIVGVVIDATDINSNEGAVAFRSNSTTDYTFFVLPEAVSYDVYTAVYMTLTGTDALMCYTDAYEAEVDLIVQILEAEIKADREQIRYEEVTGDALGELADVESEINDKLAEAEEQIQEAIQKIEDAKKELADGEAELIKGEAELEDARQELLEAQEELKRAESELVDAQKELNAAKDELVANEAKLEESQQALAEAKKELDEAEKQLNQQEAMVSQQFGEMKLQLQTGISGLKLQIEQLEQEMAQLENETELASKQQELVGLKTQLAAYEAQLVELQAQESAAKQQIEAGRAEIAAGRETWSSGQKELEYAKQQLENGRTELDKAQKELNAGKEEIATAEKQLEEGMAELEEGRKELDEGWAELEDGKAELAEGESELEASVLEYEDKKSDAKELIEEARKEIEELKMTEWYISTRTSLSGYNNIKTDAKCIESIGNAFPILFLTIAILVSLTTISRMVEEDRGLIGTYKALGFRDNEIQRKYVVYALLACILGGFLGDFLGFVVLPEIIFIIFGVMYQLPEYILEFNVLYGIGGIILFIVGIVGASIVSCKTELSHMPATLMRPKAPKNGSRVFLERVTFIWKRLSFLNKVTVRNLFRYKKRLFMTLFGIAGCTSLLIAGFTIKDTVTELMHLQYGKAYLYDAMVVAEEDEVLYENLDGDEAIESYLSIHTSNVKVINQDGKEESVQLIVVPEGSSLEGYINLYDKNDKDLTLEDGDILITINATNLLGVSKGDSILLQTMQLDMAEVEITEVVMNYLGNCVYMTQATYEELYDELEINSALIQMRSEEAEHEAWAEELAEQDGILSSSAAAGFEKDADTVFRIINLVVYVVIVLAAALAFVVLFTLATTNISERERELATIKVLGFFDKEVHLYVNKETLILTSIGIVLGLPLGKVFGEWLMSILNMPSIYFDPHIYPISFGYSAALAIVFAFIVNFITDKSLDRIDPVEALKSIE